MAPGAGMDHFDRHVRRPQTVAPQCAPWRLVPRHRPAAPQPVGKKLWARLAKSMPTVIATGCAEGQRRDPRHQADWVVWGDGDLTQIADIAQAARALGGSVVIIVDIMHVLAYLWKAVTAWLPPNDPQVAQWVGHKTLHLLHGEGKSIVRT